MYAKRAEGFGRTDWCVIDSCSCDTAVDDDCERCDGTRKIVVKQGLTESQAKFAAMMGKAFNPPKIRSK